MRSKFNIGDKVVCIESWIGTQGPVRGKVYHVIGHEPGAEPELDIIVLKGIGGWFEKRFVHDNGIHRANRIIRERI